MKIGLLGCKGTTLDFLHNLRQRGHVHIDVVVTLPDDVAERNKVAFFEAPKLRLYCEKNGIRLRQVTSYTLRSNEDRELFRSEAIDLLVVIGWERLVPPDILAGLGRWACGMHGSAFGLPRGRGRSPLNWSLITGKTKFLTSLFRYDPGVDSGDILGTAVFDINPFDSIETLHAKNRIAMVELVEQCVPRIADGSLKPVPQPDGDVSYYPKRTSEDGAIDWRQTTAQIYDLIRAVAPPYPGAFTYLNGRRIGIDWAQPFDSGLFSRRAEPGTVLDVSIATNKVVVATGDGALLVTKLSGIDSADLTIGLCFQSVDWREQLGRIVARYEAQIPPDQHEIRLL